MFITEEVIQAAGCRMIQTYIHDLRAIYMGSDNISVNEIENCSIWLSLKKLIESRFGFYSLSLVFINDGLPNTMTYPLSMSLQGMIEARGFEGKSLSSLRYSPEARFCLMMTISKGLLFSDSISEEEITGLMLHEIGHDFDFTVYRHINPFQLLCLATNFMKSVKEDTEVAQIIYNFKENKEELQAQHTTSVSKLKLAAITDFMFYFHRVEKKLGKKMYLLGLEQNMCANNVLTEYGLRWLYAYYLMINEDDKEKNANSFADKHGYGRALESGDKKIEDIEFGSDRYVSRSPILGEIYGVFSLVPIILCSDLHKTNVLDTMDTWFELLAQDVSNSDLDSLTKEELINTMRRVHDMLIQYMNTDYVRSDRAQLMFMKWVHKTFEHSSEMNDIASDYTNPFTKMNLR